jgi:EAL domain-containing protein (putative c-di-GMP-specific phosphodiesterase class I)/GGDEF domain-containing protein
MAVQIMAELGRLRRTVRAALVGPQLAAFLPALALGLYWYGGEGLLLFFALVFPGLLALTGLLTQGGERRGRRGLDPVTGLPGRPALLAAIDRAAQGGLVCLVFEIDDLASLRARYGQDSVERILRQSADRLRAMLRVDDLVVSLAPGRFAAAVGKTARVDLEVMIQLATRMQAAIAAPISLDRARILITASAGFALPGRVAEPTGAALLAAAEAALDEAQRSGPGSVRAYTAGMRPNRGAEDPIAAEVLRALDEGEIEPWFQPQISTDTGALTGFEALARWNHPDRGYIQPAAFLPAINAAGAGERLGEVILFKSLAALRDWDKIGLNVPQVAVNLSADELRNPKLYEKIRWELDRFDIDPGRLALEILEDVVAGAEDDTATRTIAALSRLGCRIDLDDFGTGHASIVNIRRFGVHRIKIDRSFVTNVDTDRDQQNMIAAILTMAERLGVDTLAEGVESVGEHAMLAQLGCGHVQGHSIARPMPFADTAAWITAHRASLVSLPSLVKRA